MEAGHPHAPSRAWLDDVFAGVTWRGVIVVALFCLFDSVQDSFAAIFMATPAQAARAILSKTFASFVSALFVVLAILAALRRNPASNTRQVAAVALALIAASLVGALFKLHWHEIEWYETKPDEWYNQEGIVYLAWFFMRNVSLGGLFAVVWTLRTRERDRRAALQQRELDASKQRGQMEEARLQALLAQIEPHFLFNTLANVRGLYRVDSASAASMLENLIRYLAVALPRMRESKSTVAREATLAEAYLGIQQMRMGSRLSFSIEVPADAETASIPAMMLLTLVENAIKHGLGPLPEGGRISIRATRTQEQLSLEVADTGRGFAEQLGNGAGLANIRARLATLYGASARLRLSVNVPRGVTATITLPCAEQAPS